jgi:O-antigen/teichoic acid export membrane protein
VAVPGLASFLGLVLVGRIAGAHVLGLVSLAWVTAVFGSAMIGFGPSQVALRSVAMREDEAVPVHRGVLVRRALVAAPVTFAAGGALWLAGRSAGAPLMLGSAWMLGQSFLLFETEVLKARRRFSQSSLVLCVRAVAGWAATVVGAAVGKSLFAAVVPQVVVTGALVLLLRPVVDLQPGDDRAADARRLGRPIGRLAAASYALGYADRYVLDLLLGPVAVGVYTLGYQLGEGALELVATPVASALLPRIVSEWNDGDREAAWRTVRRGTLAVLGASAGAVPLIVLADRAGLLDLVSKSQRFPVVAGMIALAVGAQGTTKLAYGLLLAQGRPEAANRCFWMVVVLSAVTVPAMTQLWGIVGTAGATVVGYGTLAVLMHRAARQA